jgi:hypothetical protein
VATSMTAEQIKAEWWGVDSWDSVLMLRSAARHRHTEDTT